MKGLKDKLNETNLGNPNSLTKNDNMEGLINKLDDTYLDGSPGRYDNAIPNGVKFTREYDNLHPYINTSEGTVRGQGNLLKLYETMKQDGLLTNPPTSYTTIIGSEVKTFNTSTPYDSSNTYSDQFRLLGDETLLKRTIDEYR